MLRFVIVMNNNNNNNINDHFNHENMLPLFIDYIFFKKGDFVAS